MTVETFQQLVALVDRSRTLSRRQVSDIVQHLEAISREIQMLAAENAEAAQSICNFLTCAIYESTRDERTNVLATTARKGMLLSFHPFESSHPVLTEAGYSLGNVLSALGV